jgi:hypothetical protein
MITSVMFNVIFYVVLQLEKMRTAVTLAGGSVVLAEHRGVDGVDDETLVDGSTCVMWSDAAATQSSQSGHSWIRYVQNVLSKYVFQDLL